jgi:hypothetical protein
MFVNVCGATEYFNVSVTPKPQGNGWRNAKLAKQVCQTKFHCACEPTTVSTTHPQAAEYWGPPPPKQTASLRQLVVLGIHPKFVKTNSSGLTGSADLD